MLNFLEKYSERDFFYFFPDGQPFRNCNAPKDRSGVYLVYAICGKDERLVYIGSSGKLLPNGKISIRRSGIGGIKGRLMDGKYSYIEDGLRFKVNRSKFWIKTMRAEGIEKLKIYWFITNNDCPLKKDAELRKIYTDLSGQLPEWNRI